MNTDNTFSASWNNLTPKDDKELENFEVYINRVRANGFQHIPIEVFEQWIYPLHQDWWTLRNYAWMDFTLVKFKLIEWDLNRLLNLNIIPDFENTTSEIGNPFQTVAANDEDTQIWENEGTWRIPPIVLEVNTLSTSVPPNATLAGRYQLVEGHSRYRNLLITINHDLFIAKQHKVYLMYF